MRYGHCWYCRTDQMVQPAGTYTVRPAHGHYRGEFPAYRFTVHVCRCGRPCRGIGTLARVNWPQDAATPPHPAATLPVCDSDSPPSSERPTLA